MTYSIILRTYNETDSLKNSIESVLSQTCIDWELVIVDDGSDEETLAIIDEYIRRDERIRVIHQENQGSLSAFRAGIKGAKGDYLAFLDAGDLYEANYLEEANRIIQNSPETIDMVVFGIRETFKDHDDIHRLSDGEKLVSPKELLRMMEEKIGFFGLIYRITKRDAFNYTLEEERFYDSIGRSGDYGDDLYLLSPTLRNCSSIYVTDKPLYVYTYDEGSLSHHYKSYTWEDAWNRNRLVEFTYNTVNKSDYMDAYIKGLMYRHNRTLLAPCAKWIVRHRAEVNVDTIAIQEIAASDFFYESISDEKNSDLSYDRLKNWLGLRLFMKLILKYKNPVELFKDDYEYRISAIKQSNKKSIGLLFLGLVLLFAIIIASIYFKLNGREDIFAGLILASTMIALVYTAIDNVVNRSEYDESDKAKFLIIDSMLAEYKGINVDEVSLEDRMGLCLLIESEIETSFKYRISGGFINAFFLIIQLCLLIVSFQFSTSSFSDIKSFLAVVILIFLLQTISSSERIRDGMKYKPYFYDFVRTKYRKYAANKAL